MTIKPFPNPELARLDDFRVEQIGKIMEMNGHQAFLDAGRHVLRRSSVLFPVHFHRLAVSMAESGQPESYERSFKRGAAIGLGFIATKHNIVVTDQQMYAHINDLNAYRDDKESLATAALRLGATTLHLDTDMATCAEHAVQAHPSSSHNPEVLRAGVGYVEVLAERILRDEFSASSVKYLNEQYGDELAGIFDFDQG
jgi:hypothetical protein